MSHPSDLVALANGFRPWKSAGPLASGAHKIEIRMQRGSTIRGHVMDDTGAAVRGARIWVRLPQNQIYWPRTSRLVSGAGDSDGAEGTSSEDGSFELTGVGDSVDYMVEAEKPGWLLDKGLAVRAGGDPVTLRLRRVARVHVVFIADDRTEPLSDVRWIQSPEPNLMSRDDATSREVRRRALLDSEMQVAESKPAARVFEYTLLGQSGTRPERVGYTFTAPGYDPKPVWLSLQWGRTVEERVVFSRSAVERRPVRFRAELAALLPYTGGLEVLIFPPEGGSVWTTKVNTASLQFVGGVASRVLDLPVGPAAFEIVGTGRDDGHWWDNATEGRKFTVDIPSGSGEFEARIQLRGNPVALDVRDESGRRVRGYDLAIPTRVGVREEQGWDVPWLHASEGPPIAIDNAPSIWLGPGTHLIRASIPGVGSGATEVRIAGDGTPQEVQIKLTRSR